MDLLLSDWRRAGNRVDGVVWKGREQMGMAGVRVHWERDVPAIVCKCLLFGQKIAQINYRKSREGAEKAAVC